MRQKFAGFSHRGPDNVTEELVAALSSPKAYEFKALFEVVHTALRARNAASGGEEMLRLRAYDKLQGLVAQGQVKKNGKQYKGVAKPIRELAAQLLEHRTNGPVFTPRITATAAAPAKRATPAKPKAAPVAAKRTAATPAKRTTSVAAKRTTVVAKREAAPTKRAPVAAKRVAASAKRAAAVRTQASASKPRPATVKEN